ncbi:MAG: hypothetical protein GQ563_07945, partial [Desulfuromusa sp.]|nr:hypothetical protein [Desulfuromusa sp.]
MKKHLTIPLLIAFLLLVVILSSIRNTDLAAGIDPKKPENILVQSDSEDLYSSLENTADKY